MLRSVAATVLLLFSGFVFAANQPFKDGLKYYLKGEVHRAVQIWIDLGEQGDVQAQKQLGQYYLTDDDDRDYVKSIDWYRRAASQGDEEAAGYLKNAEQQYTKWQKLAGEIGQQAAYDTVTLREHLVEGDDTNCGFVVEVKSRVVLVQTASQPRWFKKEHLYLPDTKTCSY
jgi:TPR repeat protein